MLRKADTFAIFYCLTREANLAAAKHALRLYRGARLHRQTGGVNDEIDIVVGVEIMERYVCQRHQDQCSHVETVETPPTPARVFRVEDLALYR